MKTSNKIYIIILNYNGWADTIECMESVLRNDYPNYQIILADNNSFDGSMEYIKAWADGRLDISVNQENPLKNLSTPPIPKAVPYVCYTKEEAENGGDPELEAEFKTPLIFIQTGYNGGFASGNNAGIKYALVKDDFKYVLLLNNDTVVKEDFLTNNIKIVEKDEGIGLAGCKIMYYDEPEKVWFNGGSFNEYSGRTAHIRKEVFKDYSYVNFITGTCFIIPKRTIEQINLLDETYFMYCEDLDYGYRVYKSGLKLAVIHNAKIYHKVGASKEGGELSEFSVYWIARNGIKFRMNRLKSFKKFTSISFYLLSRFIAIPKWCILKPVVAKAQIKGIIDGILNNNT